MPYAVLAVFLVGLLLLVLWLVFGRGPRRGRAFGRAQELLEQGCWEEAQTILAELQAQGRLSSAWQDRLRGAAAECHQRAGDQLLKEKRFEDSLQHYLQAATLLGQDQGDAPKPKLLGQDHSEQRQRVLDAMLAEVRRLFAAGIGREQTAATQQLLGRIFAIQASCPEAAFWLGLCLIRQGLLDDAQVALNTAHEQGGKSFIDPPFYLGVLLHRLGRPQDALRYLAEANRVDGGCPFVTWQMGLSLVAAGGDSGLALRALQRALGPRGFGLWAQRPERAWVEAFPENRSYVRRLASRHPYVCPLLGSDLTVIIRAGQMALAQAHYRQNNFQEAADLFARLLQDSPPTVPLLRGLGLSLARLQRYDQAYKHLRIALEQEEPKDPFTAGCLALCGAMGKPTQPEDRPRNVAWAVRLLARYPLFENAEWAGLISAVHAEAREVGLKTGLDEQLQLCDVLASVHATDTRAAEAYAHLACTFPDAVRPQHAWLYVRAATQYGIRSEAEADLFARTFLEAGPARAYFAQRDWSFEDAEYAYLERTADVSPGRFPDALGKDYARRGESFLLERSRQEETSGRKESAEACVDVLLRLAPRSVCGHDRLACLHYRRGDLDGAVALLEGWQRLAPADHWPLIRQAVIEQERGNARRRAEVIDRALVLTQGPLRGSIAFLGARLSLRSAMGNEALRQQAPSTGNGASSPSSLEESLSLLQTCLSESPNHTDALWCLAAVRSVLGDREGLARQAPQMNRPAVKDARFHYLGAVCHLAAGDYTRVLELGQRAAGDESLAAESQFVMAWAHLGLQEPDAARTALQKVAAVEKSPSAVCARALLGQMSFARGSYDEAIRWWLTVDPKKRAEWQLDDPLRQTVLLSGLLAYQAERFEQAADRFREAGKLGLRERRLGPLMTLALVRAGQRLLYQESLNGRTAG
jgi:tetratricopeptide (TPR) repeat protein